MASLEDNVQFICGNFFEAPQSLCASTTLCGSSSCRGVQQHMHVVISDVHIPFEDPVALRAAIDFVSREQPFVIHLLGDIVDFYAISAFSRDPQRLLRLQDELDAAAAFLARLREACPNTHIVFSEGNHEYRLRRYLMDEAVELAGLRCLRLEELLDFSEHRVLFFPHNQPYRWGKLLFTHGHLCRKWSGVTARAHFEKFGECLIVGHVHRAGSTFRTFRDEQYGAWENPCLADASAVDYTIAPDWQHGWTVISFVDGLFHVDQILLTDGQYVWQGRVFGQHVPRHGYLRVPNLSETLR